MIQQIKAWWEVADRMQKIVTIFGASFLVLLLFGTFYLTNRPEMKMLYGGLTPADQGRIIEELEKLGIAMEYDERGNIYVPKERLAEARARLAMNGAAPSDSQAGYGDLEKLGMMNTPKVEKERLKVALEGELAKSIEMMEGVQSARVHLNLGENSPFIRDSKPPSLSVTLVEGGGMGIGDTEARGIAHLVSNAVPGLEPKNVTILSSRGKILWDGANISSYSGKADKKVEAEAQEGKRREKELQQALDKAFGPGNTVAVIALNIDFDKRFEEFIEKLADEQPLSRESNEETMVGGKPGVGGVAGVNSNVAEQAPATPENAKDQNYQGKQLSEQFGSNEKRTRLESNPGKVTSMSINVLVDENVIKNPEQVRQFIQGYLGPYDGDPKFTATVTSVPFDRKAEEAAKKELELAASAAKNEQMISLLPIVAIVLVGILIAKAVGKASADQREMILNKLGQKFGQSPYVSEESNLPLEGSRVPGQALPSGEMALETEAQKQLPPHLAQLPPEARMMPAEAFMANMTGGSPEYIHHQGSDQLPNLQILGIPDKINIPLEQIKRMAEQKPQAIALLIKTWLSEEGR